MVDEAVANAESDKEKSKKIDLKNQSDSLCYQTKKQLQELDTQISSEDKNKIEDLIKELEDALGIEDYEKMNTLNEKIKTAVMEVGEKIYSSPTSPMPKQGDVDFSAEK